PDTEKYEYIESTPVKKGEVGKDYTIKDADSEYESKYTADGYTVNATKNEDYSIKIEDKDKTYEMNVYYDPPKTTYKTEYYLEQPDGSFKKEDEITSGETYAGKTVNAEEKTYDGYTHVIVDESLETDFVKPDGSTTLKVYYKYPGPVYKTEYYVEQEDGTYKLYTSKDDDGNTGEEVEAEIINIEGYEHTTVPESHEKDTVKADSSTVLKVYYNKVKKPSYKVQYYVEQEDGTYKIYTEKKDIPGTAGQEVEAEIIKIKGYEHTTTPNSLEKDTVKEDNSTVLKVYYNKVKDPVYTVQYYVQQKDGTYKLYTEKTNLKGKEGEEVKADIIKIPGYVHTTTDDSNEKDVVNGDGSTVLKVYYDLEPEEPTTEEPTTEEPEPTTEEPTTEEPEPTTEEPTTEAPTTEEPTTEKPTVEQPTTQPPTTKAPVKEVKTGDSTSNSLFVMLLSAMVVAYGCFFGRKKKNEE
ncbi:MAG: LPXTG cell wall anchor domain-containing protein, partial [Lachnospiraceae bacterium]|nr:LPXTG cell wall anchor domain-containing protein [Lachnospiraceae bacterium]